MKRFSMKHYYKIIAFLIVLSTVPVIITGTLSYWQSSKAIVDYSNDEKKQNIYQIQTNVEQVLKYVDLSITYFVRSTQTQEFLNQDMKAAQFADFHKLRRDLNHLQTLETGIEDIVLVSFDKRWLINNDGLVNLEQTDYEKINSQYLSLPQKSTWVMEEADEIGFENATKKSCSHYINLVKRLPLLSSTTEGMISALIPSCELTEIMGQNTDSESFLILDGDNQTIAHSNTTYIGEDGYIPNALYEKIDRSADEGQFEYDLNGLSYKVIYQSSDYNDWTYISFVKLSDLHMKSSAIGWLTIIICSILLVLSLFFAFIGSRVLYQPIKKLKGLIHHEDNQLDNENEFVLIETHIENLLNQNDQLEKRMQKQITQLKQLFMMRLYQGKVSENEIPVKVKAFNYSQTWTWMTVFSLQIDSVDKDKFNKNDQDLLLFAINNLMEDLLGEDKRFTPVVMNDIQVTTVLTVCDSDSAYTHHINQTAQLIQEKVESLFHLSVSIGISQRFKELTETKTAFAESKEALKYRLKMGEASIIYYENLNRKYSKVPPYPSAIKNKLFDAIKLSDKDNAKYELNRLFEYIDHHDMYHHQLDIILSRFLYELFELKEMLGVNIEGFSSTEMVKDYQQFNTLTEIKNWLHSEIIMPLIDHVDERTDSKNKKISDRMIKLIHENYDKDISLDRIAAELHYNPNYLSSIFQKETHYSFSEYLLRYRLNKAKEWLTSTNKSVKEIAEELQYNNSQNFIRSFRKIEGITPGKYRSEFKN
ncbi:AraC family transcriptional regulator [Saliterribacillus persicus]|nr:helix-turn-helix domain-containing protein [Saliterribacillus persicus]